MSTVFISYRRQTAAGEARALFNDLVARLGESAVFMDVDSISLGRDFRSELQKTLAACDLMLVIIDKDWAAVKDERGRTRLEDAGDFVRMEIEAGLKRNIAVTPVLVKGAQMPAPEALPAEIRDLAYRNGFELSHSRWESDVREMIRRLSLEEAGGGSVPARVKLRVDREGPRHAAEGDRRRQAPPTARRKSLVIAGVLGVVCLGGVAAWLSIPKPEPSTPAQILPAMDDRQTFNRDGANVSTSPQETGSKPIAVASDKVIEVWFAGSPHAAQQPSITVPSGILDAARTLGYSVGSRGYLATDFLPELLKAVGAGNPPDIIFIDNYIHLEGGRTALGLFKGMQSDAGLRTRLLNVSGALDDLGKGWAFLVAGSPDHDGAEALVTELSGCPMPMTTPVEALLRRLQLQAETVVRGFLQCAPDDPSILDRDSLSRRCAGKPSNARRVTVCRITAAPKLAFVETAAAVTGEYEVGRHSFVSVHRLDGDWRLLTVTEDPVSTRQTAERWRFVRAIAGNSVIAIERLVLEQILLPRTSQDDQSERLVGLVHAMDRLGDFSVSKRLPLAFRNGRDHGLDRRVMIRPDRKDLVGLLAIIEDIRPFA